MDLRLEVVIIPVSDVDRAKQFYKESLGFREDADFNAETYEKTLGFKAPGDASFRVVQLTPPGSACSIHFGTGITRMVPGSVQGTYLITNDIEATRAELIARGVQVSKLFHNGSQGRASGIDPQHTSYNSYMTFNDPDGNGWLIQEITQRLPGR